MAHSDTVMELMNQLVSADKHIIGDIMAHTEIWTAGTSSVNNSYKALNLLVDAGRLERGDGFFRLPGCKSEYKEHAKALTNVLVEIIKLNLDYKIFREPTVKGISLRPDALVHLQKNDHSIIMVLEVCLNELPIFLDQKVHAWQQYDAALEELSTLFQPYIIKSYDIVVSGDYIPEGTQEFNSYLKEVTNEYHD